MMEYKIVSDTINNTPESIARGELHFDIYTVQKPHVLRWNVSPRRRKKVIKHLLDSFVLDINNEATHSRIAKCVVAYMKSVQSKTGKYYR